MTPPRYNAPGTTWLVTRRCSERRFFLRPDAFVTRALLYVLGFAATLYGIEVHAAVALSNHWHLVLTDTRGRKSAFLQFVHMMIATGMASSSTFVVWKQVERYS
jgi:REP element-mobilizing transposase RayT